MRYSAVLFDLDGLMIDTERMVRAAFEASSAELGFPMPSDLFPRLIGRTGPHSSELIQHAFGPTFPMDEFRANTQRRYEADLAENGIAQKRGIVDMLSALTTHEVPYAVATSTARERAWWKMELAGIASHFDTLVGGDEIERSKPAPDIFIEAARRLGVRSEACIVLEDSPAGIEAAHAAGMTPIMVPDLSAPDPLSIERAFAVVADLHEARTVLSDLFGRRFGAGEGSR